MEKIDVLKWWKINRVRYPNIFLLASKYLCITAISVPSEKIFSKAGEIMSKKRSQISTKHLKNCKLKFRINFSNLVLFFFVF